MHLHVCALCLIVSRSIPFVVTWLQLTGTLSSQEEQSSITPYSFCDDNNDRLHLSFTLGQRFLKLKRSNLSLTNGLKSDLFESVLENLKIHYIMASVKRIFGRGFQPICHHILIFVSEIRPEGCCHIINMIAYHPRGRYHTVREL